MGSNQNSRTVVDGEKELPRFAIIGAGSRGTAYAQAVYQSKLGVVVSIADPIASKRRNIGSRYIWSGTAKKEDAEFESWQDFLEYEKVRREKQASGEETLAGVDGVFICTLDHTHKEVIEKLAPLGLHIMCEKPLATSLRDCTDIYNTVKPKSGDGQARIFSIGHVLRYSPHNMLLHDLVLKDKVIGDILSIEHTEPVGWSHFSHSYVRGNWRKESIAAPSLLTKSCHDIDFLLWLLCSTDEHFDPHLPSQVASTGALSFFKRSRKPKAAGNATNCLSCPHEPDCTYSAKKIYLDHQLRKGNSGWPVKIVHPEIEDLYVAGEKKAAEAKLLSSLSENYTTTNTTKNIESRSWYGRCVWESDNDVCDDQIVTMTWKDENSDGSGFRSAKTASFHMVAFTESQCLRRGRIYGTKGELEYDSKVIRTFTFDNQVSQVYHPHQPDQLEGSHGGGDAGLTKQFVKAVTDVKNGVLTADKAQTLHIGCTFEDVIRSHAMVFAAEEARLQSRVIDWNDWWKRNVLDQSTAINQKSLLR